MASKVTTATGSGCGKEAGRGGDAGNGGAAGLGGQTSECVSQDNDDDDINGRAAIYPSSAAFLASAPQIKLMIMRAWGLLFIGQDICSYWSKGCVPECWHLIYCLP